MAMPDVELFHRLAKFYDVSMEELMEGEAKLRELLTYAKAGVDIGLMDHIKKEMAISLVTDNPRVLNGLGPFAALFDINFPQIKQPVLVLKSEEPGSKQMLAFQYGYVESICHDMINHLVNDIIVMGATPLAVLDTIICSKAEKGTIKSIVKGISDACIQIKDEVIRHFANFGCDCYEIGRIEEGNRSVGYSGKLNWKNIWGVINDA